MHSRSAPRVGSDRCDSSTSYTGGFVPRFNSSLCGERSPLERGRDISGSGREAWIPQCRYRFSHFSHFSHPLSYFLRTHCVFAFPSAAAASRRSFLPFVIHRTTQFAVLDVFARNGFFTAVWFFFSLSLSLSRGEAEKDGGVRGGGGPSSSRASEWLSWSIRENRSHVSKAAPSPLLPACLIMPRSQQSSPIAAVDLLFLLLLLMMNLGPSLQAWFATPIFQPIRWGISISLATYCQPGLTSIGWK